MSTFPDAPVSPATFMEEVVPRLFEAGDRPPELLEVDVRLGVRIDGDGGGEWVMHLHGGQLSVSSESREAASFTVVQTVDDWRGALWEGRGGVFGEAAATLFRQGGVGGDAAAEAASPVPGSAPDPASIAQLEALNGLIKVVVTGGEGGDWATGFKLGPGAIPEEPSTTIQITDEDARAMQSGELDAMQAFMGGKILVTGDMGLMMQMQAIAMQAAAAAAQRARESS
jgi:hypothetical protein